MNIRTLLSLKINKLFNFYDVLSIVVAICSI